MREARPSECAAHTEARDDRMQALPPVDLLVEERVEEVEAPDPEGHRRAEHPRLPGQSAGDRDPGANGREAVHGAQPEVAEPSEPLEIRIDDEAHDGNRPEPAHERVQLPDGG